MRRSIMIQKMKEIIRTSRWDSTAEELAERLLTMQEDSGMSPEDWDGTVYGQNEGYVQAPKWEPEE